MGRALLTSWRTKETPRTIVCALIIKNPRSAAELDHTVEHIPERAHTCAAKRGGGSGGGGGELRQLSAAQASVRRGKEMSKACQLLSEAPDNNFLTNTARYLRGPRLRLLGGSCVILGEADGIGMARMKARAATKGC